MTRLPRPRPSPKRELELTDIHPSLCCMWVILSSLTHVVNFIYFGLGLLRQDFLELKIRGFNCESD